MLDLVCITFTFYFVVNASTCLVFTYEFSKSLWSDYRTLAQKAIQIIFSSSNLNSYR